MADNPEDFPALRAPPINEVVCSFGFDAVPALDTLALGTYWGTRTGDFSDRSLMPAILDTPRFHLGAFPLRVFLVKTDDQFVLQLQDDRLIMNWRARGRGYPRFSERHGPDGLLRRASDEFERFSAFAQDRFGQTLNVRYVELSKIDHLERGRHWVDFEDLEKVVPVTGVFTGIHESVSRELNLTFVETAEDGRAVVTMATMLAGTEPVGFRIETMMRVASTNDTTTASFERANKVLNRAFFRLLNPKELHRFGASQ